LPCEFLALAWHKSPPRLTLARRARYLLYG